jgi:hypothetical protein
VSGPFETEDQARKAAHQVVQPEPRRSILSFEQNRELLRRALEGACVTSGAYDDRILRWLGNWEDSVVSVIAGWVTRAAAGKPDATPAAEDVPRCAQCGGPAETCPDPYMDRMLWRHQRGQVPASVADFLDAEHEAAPAGAL